MGGVVRGLGDGSRARYPHRRTDEYMAPKNGKTRLAIGVGIFYAISVVIGASFAGGSNGNPNIGYGVIFGPLFALVTLPMVFALQAGMVYVVGRITKRLTTEPALWGHAPIILLSVLFLCIPFQGPVPPETRFRMHVADDIPESVSDIESWHRRGFGNSQWSVIFRIAPEDFSAVLAKYPYDEGRIEEGLEPWVPDEFAGKIDRPLVYSYSYSEPGPGGGLHVNLYANGEKSQVLLVGSYDCLPA